MIDTIISSVKLSSSGAYLNWHQLLTGMETSIAGRLNCVKPHYTSNMKPMKSDHICFTGIEMLNLIKVGYQDVSVLRDKKPTVCRHVHQDGKRCIQLYIDHVQHVASTVQGQYFLKKKSDQIRRLILFSFLFLFYGFLSSGKKSISQLAAASNTATSKWSVTLNPSTTRRSSQHQRISQRSKFKSRHLP